jgi:hypothetical protein
MPFTFADTTSISIQERHDCEWWMGCVALGKYAQVRLSALEMEDRMFLRRLCMRMQEVLHKQNIVDARGGRSDAEWREALRLADPRGPHHHKKARR